MLKALKIKKVATHNFLNGLLAKASLKLIRISFKLPPIVLKVNGFKLSSFFVEALFIKIAGTKKEFIASLAIEIDQDNAQKQANCIKKAAGNTWEARVNEFWKIVEPYCNTSH